MSQRLTQRDINAMVRGQPLAPPEPPHPVPYNFRQAPRLPRERRILLDACCGEFARNLQTLLTVRLRESVAVKPAGVEQLTNETALQALSSPCAGYHFRAREGALGFMDFGTDLALHIVDRIFGGDGETGNPPRALTSLEQTVVRSIAERGLSLLTEALLNHLVLTPEILEYESEPAAIHIGNPHDTVVVANLEVMAGTVQGYITLVLPAPLFASVTLERTHRAPVVDTQSRQVVGSVLHQAHMVLAARSPEFLVPARELAQLAPGQVLLSRDRPEDPILVLVNGRVRFQGVMGQHERNLGVRLGAAIQSTGQGRTVPTRYGRITMLDTDTASTPSSGNGHGGAPAPTALDALRDVSLPVVIEFGRTRMTVQQVLELSPGAVVQLDRMVGDPVDVYVSDRRLAEGEVVMVGEHFGIRIQRLLSDPADSAAE